MTFHCFLFCVSRFFSQNLIDVILVLMMNAKLNVLSLNCSKYEFNTVLSVGGSIGSQRYILLCTVLDDITGYSTSEDKHVQHLNHCI